MFLTRRFIVGAVPSTGIALSASVLRRLRAALLAALVLFGLSMVILQAGQFNMTGFFAVQRWTRAVPDTVWATLTICGTGIVALGLLSPTLVWQPRWVAAFLVAVAPAGLYSVGLKKLFALPRPAGIVGADPILTHPADPILTRGWTLAA